MTNVNETPTPSLHSRCRHCGGAMGTGALEGECPRCLISYALENEPEPTCLPTRFGDYELLAVLGEGGEGRVYKARQIGTHREVALKRILNGELADTKAQRRFRDDARAAIQLRHPGVVRVLEEGKHEGQLYYTMELMSGGTLADRVNRFAEPRQAATLIAKLARAVHACPGAGIIHRDLKPENILFDDHGEPCIADFGVAKRLDRMGSTTTGVRAGTLYYMAPEIAAGKANLATQAADIWSLGVILYELLTDRRPFSGATEIEVLRSVLEADPEPLERLRPEVGQDLSTICLTCLRREPAARYISAKALADDLDRYLRREPIEACRPGRVTRALRWCGHHPVPTGAAAGALGLLIAVIVGSLSVASSREAALLREVQQSNAWGARLVAVSYLYQLERFGLSVVELASDPELTRALEAGDSAAAQAFLESATVNLDDFATWAILDANGYRLARVPLVDAYDRDFSHRDYFQGPRRHVGVRGIDAVHVSRVFKSTLDGRTKFVFSIAIWTGDPEDPRFLGVISGNLTSSSMTALLTQLNDGRRGTALASRAEDDDPSLKQGYQILIHPSYGDRESAVNVEDDRIGAILSPDPSQPGLRLPPAGSPLDRPVVEQDQYIDSVAAQRGDTSRHLAVFAPIANTDHVAIVHQRYDVAIEPDHTLTRRLAWAVAAAFLLGTVIAALAAIDDRLRAARHSR
jgi:eukaryotic-like serine/threonine-protein kinase